MKEGDLPGGAKVFFDDDDDDDDGAGKFTKMPTSVSEFADIGKVIHELIFGEKPDKILSGINKFMKDV